MYKEMIALANTALKKSKVTLGDDEKQFIVFYAFKTGDMKQVKELIREMEQVEGPGEREEIFQRYSNQMKLKGGVEHLAEKMLVCIERYRLEQENAIGYLSATLRLNGIQISEEEIRNTDMMQLKEKIAKVAAR